MGEASQSALSLLRYATQVIDGHAAENPAITSADVRASAKWSAPLFLKVKAGGVGISVGYTTISSASPWDLDCREGVVDLLLVRPVWMCCHVRGHAAHQVDGRLTDTTCARDHCDCHLLVHMPAYCSSFVTAQELHAKSFTCVHAHPHLKPHYHLFSLLLARLCDH